MTSEPRAWIRGDVVEKDDGTLGTLCILRRELGGDPRPRAPLGNGTDDITSAV